MDLTFYCTLVKSMFRALGICNFDSDIKIAKKSQGINEILLALAKNSQDHSTSKAASQIQTRFFTNNIE